MTKHPTMVVDPTEVEGIVSSIRLEPLDPAEITRFWKIFTSIKRSPFDPIGQASRLENFWWRVWGSRQKGLPGLVLADLFHKLVNDSLFVVPQQPSLVQTAITREDRIEIIHRPAIASSLRTNKIAATPHPILRKSRDPTTTATRPTARFASPHESEEKKSFNQETYAICTSSPPGSQGARSDKKRATGPIIPKKKGTVVLAPKRKRPINLRRLSSQSSNDVTKKVLDSNPTVGEQISSTGKRPSIPLPPGSEKSSANKTQITKNPRSMPKVRRASGTSTKSVLRRTFGNSSTRSAERGIIQPTEKDAESRRHDDKGKQIDRDPLSSLPEYPIVARSVSPHIDEKIHTNYSNSKFIFRGKIPSHTLGAAHIPSAEATSMVSCHNAAPGQIYSQALMSKAKMAHQDELRRTSDGNTTPKKMFSSPSTGGASKSRGPPAQATSLNVSNELSKSKSQLTLLLEKDRARHN